MQYYQYPPASHPSPSQSPDDYPPPYPDLSHQHAAVTPATPFPARSIAHHPISPQHNYSTYPTQGTSEDPPYYPSLPQGSATEHYHVASFPTTSYGGPSPSSHLIPLIPHPPRHDVYLSQSQETGYPAAALATSYQRADNRIRTPPAVYDNYPQASTHAEGERYPGEHREPTFVGSHVHMQHHTTVDRTPPTTVRQPVPDTGRERYPREHCGHTFRCLYDRRRHCETVHATAPKLYECQTCRRSFSRSDFLKRHIANGCDGVQI